MLNFFWRILAKVLARPAIADWLIARAKLTPYQHIMSADGIALVVSRTDAEWFQEAMASASATLLIKGRIAFVPGHENSHKKGRSGAGSAMFAFGDECAIALQGLADLGVLVPRIAAWPVFDVNPPPTQPLAGVRREEIDSRKSVEPA